jgi:hypothetical protein
MVAALPSFLRLDSPTDALLHWAYQMSIPVSKNIMKHAPSPPHSGPLPQPDHRYSLGSTDSDKVATVQCRLSIALWSAIVMGRHLELCADCLETCANPLPVHSQHSFSPNSSLQLQQHLLCAGLILLGPQEARSTHSNCFCSR